MRKKKKLIFKGLYLTCLILYCVQVQETAVCRQRTLGPLSPTAIGLKEYFLLMNFLIFFLQPFLLKLIYLQQFGN